MQHVDRPIRLVMVGEGTQRDAHRGAGGIAGRGRSHRRLPDRWTSRGLIDLYKGALAVIYSPFDEDYGYVTLESFLSHKPVITTTDAGGPLEFVEHETSGFVCRAHRRGGGSARSIVLRRTRDWPRGLATPDTNARGSSRGTASSRNSWGVESRRVQQSRVSMKKLIIQIPCLNEADTLPSTLRDLPREIPGIDTIEVLVIDDGSTDGTVEVARAAGVRAHHLASQQARSRHRVHDRHRRGAEARRRFHRQYRRRQSVRGRDIPTLVAPLVSGEADIVIGDRNVETLKHLSWTRKRLQHLGSWVVRQVSNTRVPGHDERLPRLHARSGAADEHRLGLHVHARIDHPGRQEADGDCARARFARTRRRAPRGCSTTCGSTSSDRRRRSCASTRCTSRSRCSRRSGS